MDIQKKKSKKGSSAEPVLPASTKSKKKISRVGSDISPRARSFVIVLGSAWGIFFLLGTCGVLYNVAFAGSTLPGLTVGARESSSISRDQLRKNILSQVSELQKKKWQFTYQDKKFEADAEQLGLTIDAQKTLNAAWEYGHSESFLDNIYDEVKGLFQGHREPIASSFALDDYNYYVQNALADVAVAPKNASLTVDGDNIVHLVPADVGRSVDTPLLRAEIRRNIADGVSRPIPIITSVSYPAISNQIARASIPHISALLRSPFTLTYQNRTWELTAKDIRSWISTRAAVALEGTAPTDTPDTSVSSAADTTASITTPVPLGADMAVYVDSQGAVTSQLADPTKTAVIPALSGESITNITDSLSEVFPPSDLTARVANTLHLPSLDQSAHSLHPLSILVPVFEREALNKTFDTISRGIDQQGQNVVLAVEEGRLVVKQASKAGRGIDRPDAIQKIVHAVQSDSSRTIALRVDEIDPEVTENNLSHLGIKQLIGEGVSDFVGSTKSRIHNIRTAVARFQGALVKPGEELSFTKILGPVEASTGYLPELVIKGTKITPEYGGGVCQVSTTLFRAAVLSGLQITRRQNHSFVVHYYGTPGMDATVYYPNPDMRFVNNTPSYILIQARFEGTKLYFDLYGTSDGRTVRTEGPYLYDKGPGGAVKASWTQIVMRDGAEVSRKTFNSVYKPVTSFTRTGFQN